MEKILTADIGGTNSRFAHFETSHAGELKLVGTKWLETRASTSFGNLIELLHEDGFSLRAGDADMVVVAVAGPVERGCYSSPPFISWDIDISNSQNDYGFSRCLLINDFVAQAFACRSPIAASARQILSGQIMPDAVTCVIGAGTALGQAALVPDGVGGFVAVPSEGGHANFPFVSPKELRFQEFLLQETGEQYITAGTVVSGKGLSHIYHFLTGERLPPNEVVAKMLPDSEALTWAARFYGRVCRNYALETVALGGVYIAGGVAARTPELLTHQAFADEFRSSKTMSALLEKIPLYLITNEESGLWGAAFFGMQNLGVSSANI